VVIRQQTGWNTYSSVNGALVAHLEVAPGFATAWTLATDESYLLFAGAEGVQADRTTGNHAVHAGRQLSNTRAAISDFANTLFDTSTGDAVRIGLAATGSREDWERSPAITSGSSQWRRLKARRGAPSLKN